MFRQESGRMGADQMDGSDMGSSQGGSMGDGQAQGQGGFVDAAKEKIQQLASQARETASGQVESRFSSGKTRATQSLGSVAQSLRSSSQQLRDQQQTGIGNYAERAADKIDEISRYLENASLNDVAQRVENFARREPVWFIGSAVALGFFGARFLKSSQRNQQGQMNMQGFQGGMQQGYQGGSQQGYGGSQGYQGGSQQGYQGGMQGGADMGTQGSGNAWQGTGDRDVTSTPRREWTTVGNERQADQTDNPIDRTGRA